MIFSPYDLYNSAANGGSGGISPSLVLLLDDLGAGAVNTAPIFGSGSITPTYSRATTGWTKLSTGLWASVATGVARSAYLGANSAVGAYGGYLAEGARTNLLIQSNDMTNVAWVPTTMTTAMTSTGPDGAANSATRLTATGAGAVSLQLYVAAAANRTYSAWIRRVTGTGTIKLFQGATKSADLAASLNASTYTQVQLDATVDVTLTGVGIEIGTSGDAIDVWCNQFEAGSFASTPIPTTTTALARNADVLTYPSAGNISGTVGSFYVEATFANVTAGTYPTLASTSGPKLIYNSGGWISAFDGTANIFNGGSQGLSANTVTKFAQSWSGTTTTGFINGVAPVNKSGPQNYDGDWGFTDIAIGYDGTSVAFGTIRGVKIYPKALTAAQLQAMTTP